MVWYYADGDRQRGPISDEEFQELVNNGQIHNETLIWKDGMDDWQRIEKSREDGPAPAGPSSPLLPVQPDSPGIPPSVSPVQPIISSPVSTPTSNSGSGSRCSQCGRGPLGIGDGVKLGNIVLCPNCNDDMARHYSNNAAIAPHRPSAVQSGTLVFASILSRAVAKFVDNLVESLIMIVLVAQTVGFSAFVEGMGGRIGGMSPEFLTTLRPILLGLLIFRVFYDALLVGFFSATLGKMVMSIRVVAGDGTRVKFNQAFVRAIAPAILQLPAIFLPSSSFSLIVQFVFLFGYFMAIYDPQKRTLYDHVAGTRVVGK